VLKPGRSFLRRMIGLDKSAHFAYSAVMLSTLALREADIIATSDASSSRGCGAFWDNYKLQMAWDGNSKALPQLQ